MTYEVTFAALAESDLDSIYDYIARDSPANAINWVRRLRKQCADLADMPERGRRRDDMSPGIHTISFERRALIAYRIQGRKVRILRVLYAGQNYPDSMEESRS